MSDATERLNAALEGRYAFERELGEGGMATHASSRRHAYVPICVHTYSLAAKRRWRDEQIDRPFVPADARPDSACP